MGLTLFRHVLGSNSCSRRPSLISLGHGVCKKRRKKRKGGEGEREGGSE